MVKVGDTVCCVHRRANGRFHADRTDTGTVDEIDTRRGVFLVRWDDDGMIDEFDADNLQCREHDFSVRVVRA